MSANNRRLRRLVVDILFTEGPLTRTQIAEKLANLRSLREVPSDNSLSSVLAKNVQLESVGFAKVEKLNGNKTKHMVFDIKRDLISNHEEIEQTRPMSCMTAQERTLASRCPQCGRHRILPKDKNVCLHCVKGL